MTPDFQVLIGLYTKQKTGIQEQFLNHIVRTFLPGVTAHRAVFVINNNFRAWGHTFLYDKDTLTDALRTAGFEDITAHKVGSSDDPISKRNRKTWRNTCRQRAK